MLLTVRPSLVRSQVQLDHDSALALEVLVWLVNTDDQRTGIDELAEPRALVEYVDERRITGAVAGDQAELRAVRRLRARLRGIFDLVDDGDPDAVVGGDQRAHRRHRSGAPPGRARRPAAAPPLHARRRTARPAAGSRDRDRAGHRRPRRRARSACGSARRRAAAGSSSTSRRTAPGATATRSARTASTSPPTAAAGPSPADRPRVGPGQRCAGAAGALRGLERLVGLDAACLPQLVPARAGAAGEDEEAGDERGEGHRRADEQRGADALDERIVGRVQQLGRTTRPRRATAGRARSTTRQRAGWRRRTTASTACCRPGSGR